MREAQRQRKERRAAQAHNARAARGEATPSDRCVASERDQSRARVLEGFPRSISRLEYFNACSGGLFRHPSLRATRESIAALLQALRAANVLVTTTLTLPLFMTDRASCARSRRSSTRVITSSSPEPISGIPPSMQISPSKGSSPSQLPQVISPLYDSSAQSRLPAHIVPGPRGEIEPLPELQPYYGVLHWEDFERSKHVCPLTCLATAQ